MVPQEGEEEPWGSGQREESTKPEEGEALLQYVCLCVQACKCVESLCAEVLGEIASLRRGRRVLGSAKHIGG